MDKEYKDLCQVFTPDQNVIELLDWGNYKQNLYDKKIIENSCGNGQILKEVVKRYIEDSIKNNKKNKEIKSGLENHIYGIEYDPEKYNECIHNLDKIVKEYGLKNINWKNIKQKDTLTNIEKNKFDYVVGNPPYIKYKSLSIEDREYIKNKFSTCKNGKFDYCYAFIEASMMMLNDKGTMAYLIPSSIFKNVFAQNLRNFIKPHILKIYDYTTAKLFNKETNDIKKNRLTSSIIMILKKNSNQNYIEYIDVMKNTNIKIEKNNLKDKWIFKEKVMCEEKKRRFGDYFSAANTIATLYNNAYIIKEYTEDEKYIYPLIGGKIEKKVLKDTISPKTFNRDKIEKIIFPYYYWKNELKRYSEEEFERKFPNTCKYLKEFEKWLQGRKSDKNAEWFEYGRSQALKNSNQEKILLSTVITNKVNTKILSADNIPYSGIYITRKCKKDLKYADKILNSKDFYEYLCSKGINASGNSIRITARDINEYMF